MTKQARIILEDGSVFSAKVFAESNEKVGELVFNTSMTGYEEICTDPSYKGQIVVMCYPLIGNYGCSSAVRQSRHCHLEGMIVKKYCSSPQHYDNEISLASYLETENVMGLCDVDTRALTRYLRDNGSQMALITSDENLDIAQAQAKIKQHTPTSQRNFVKDVSCKKAYTWRAPDQPLFNVAVLDCGVKFGILDALRSISAAVTVYPYHTSAEEILTGGYDGILISNGPGNPENTPEVVDTIRQLLGKIPLFGICLGQQFLALALDIPLVKLGFGHHGANHPVLNLETKRVEISSQNHIYNVDSDVAKSKGIHITHINLNDQTVAGFSVPDQMAFSVQYHPEACPGPGDSAYLFEAFAKMMTNKTAVSFQEFKYAKA